MAALIHKLFLLTGLLSLFHAAYSAAQRKQRGNVIYNKINIMLTNVVCSTSFFAKH